MDKKIEEKVKEIIKEKKDKEDLKKELYGKVSAFELNEALELYDSLIKRKNLKYYLGVLFFSIKLFFLYIIFCIAKFYGFVRKIFFLEGEEEITFKDFKETLLKNGLVLSLVEWFNRKNKKEKIKTVLVIFILIIITFIVVYANFFYYKKCENKTCLKEMLEKCNRAKYISKDFIILTNKIKGRTIDYCIVKVYSEKEMMKCKIPLGENYLPYSNLQRCSGELREKIQEEMISELQQIFGENIKEINEFFKLRK
ncbi:MAG: hypothetical protein QW273_02370 [Candidatus Pacearchaeota archaeon]